MAKKTDEPLTKGAALQLVKEVQRTQSRDDARYQDYERLCDQAIKEESRLHDSAAGAKLRRLESQRDAAYTKWSDERNKDKAAATNLRHNIMLYGVTPANKAALKKLLGAK